MNTKPKLIFTERALPFILEALGKTTDAKGFVIDEKTKEFVLDYYGHKFKPKELMGIFDKHWITSVFQLLEISHEKPIKAK